MFFKKKSTTELERTYEIVRNAQGSQGIHCLVCHMVSWNPLDVSNRYCSNCQEFHDLRLQKRLFNNDRKRKMLGYFPLLMIFFSLGGLFTPFISEIFFKQSLFNTKISFLPGILFFLPYTLNASFATHYWLREFKELRDIKQHLQENHPQQIYQSPQEVIEQ